MHFMLLTILNESFSVEIYSAIQLNHAGYSDQKSLKLLLSAQSPTIFKQANFKAITISTP